eukprot:644147-Amphidinium_carterae.1
MGARAPKPTWSALLERKVTSNLTAAHGSHFCPSASLNCTSFARTIFRSSTPATARNSPARAKNMNPISTAAHRTVASAAAGVTACPLPC